MTHLREGGYKFVVVYWRTAPQPNPRWFHPHDESEVYRDAVCASAGWLVESLNSMVVLAANVAEGNDDENIRISGITKIPACCVIKIKEPEEV